MGDAVEDLMMDLLESERAAIRRGEFDGLSRHAERKARLFARIAYEPLDTDALSRIGTEVGRNQRLLSAAMGGLRDAGARLRAMKIARESFSTYDARGRVETFTRTHPGFEHKA